MWLPLLVDPDPTAVNCAPLSERRLLTSLTVNTPEKEPTMTDFRTSTCDELDAIIATAVDRAGNVHEPEEALDWLRVASDAADLKCHIKPKKATSF